MLAGLVALALSGWASGDPRLEQGRRVYREACAACHGEDGRGNPAREGAARPPDLATPGSTAERADHWEAIVSRGGKAFGLSSAMPAYGETLAREEIAAAVAYLRSLTPGADRYPPGELNPRRLVVTGKAFPETELLLQGAHATDGSSDSLLHARFENRIGKRLSYGVALPVRPVNTIYDELWGVGNVSVELKGVVAFSARRGAIASVGLETELPTGSRARNLGSGTWVWKPFAAAGWSRGRWVAQSACSFELPSDLVWQDRQFVYAGGLARALGLPKTAWTPAVELSGVVNPRRHFWRNELVVELSKPISRLGHVVAAAGVRTPLGARFGPTRVEWHVLWDFSEGAPWRGF